MLEKMVIGGIGMIDIITAHAGADCAEDCIESWHSDNYGTIFVEDGYDHGMLKAYEKGWRKSKANFIAFIHDDVIIREPWIDKGLDAFDDPSVGLVGFGGALQHGRDDIYKTPYDYRQVGRFEYISNTDDAEVHGERFTGTREVAVLDGFCLILRRDLLERCGGWPIDKLDYIGYDYWISCMAHRLGFSIRLIGIRCHHLGGKTAVALGKNFDPDGEAYKSSHKYIYDEFRDVLPWRTK